MIILWLSLVPVPPPVAMPLLSWDKFQHAAAYGMLTLLAGRAIGSCEPGQGRCWLMAALAAILFGGLVELVQAFLTTHRSGDWHDLLADAVGSAVVVLAVRLWARR
jgi:VanZ family protein